MATYGSTTYGSSTYGITIPSSPTVPTTGPAIYGAFLYGTALYGAAVSDITSLTLIPFTPVWESVYARMIGALPASTFRLTAPYLLPASNIGNSFTLLGLIPGVKITIYVDGKEVLHLIPRNEIETFTIRVEPSKKHVVEAVDAAGNKDSITIACTYYATMLYALARDWYINVRAELDDTERQLTSRFSSRLLEHRLKFENLFPRVRAFRRQLVRMSAKVLVNEMTTQRGVIDLATAATGQTPIIQAIASDKQYFEPDIKLLYNNATDFGGFEFHNWLYNLCAVEWTAFIKLAANIPDSIYELIEVKESSVKLKYLQGDIEQHAFDFTQPQCLLENILTNFLDCFSSIRSYMLTSVHSEYAFCPWAYPLDTGVRYPLGIGILDTGSLDSGGTLDTEDSIDPVAAGADGWVGLSTTERLDGSHCLDTVGKPSSLITDLSCCYSGPPATFAETEQLALSLDEELVATGTGDSSVSTTYLTGQFLILDNNFDPGDSVSINGTALTYNVEWVAGADIEETASNIVDAVNLAAILVSGNPVVATLDSTGTYPLVSLSLLYAGAPPTVPLAVVNGSGNSLVRTVVNLADSKQIGYVVVVDNNFDIGDTVTIGGISFVNGTEWTPGLAARLSAEDIARAVNEGLVVDGSGNLVLAVGTGANPVVALFIQYLGVAPSISLAVTDPGTTNFYISGAALA